MSTGLRLTDTNSTSDSKGSVWGIEGNLFWVLLAAAVTSMALLLVLFSLLMVPLLLAVIPAGAPLALALAYALFKQAHGPGYDLDLIEYWIVGPAFGPRRRLVVDD